MATTFKISQANFAHHEVIAHEVKAVIRHAPPGDEPGYELRFVLKPPVAGQQPALSEPYFLSDAGMEAHLGKLQQFVATEGHLAPKNQPGPSVQ